MAYKKPYHTNGNTLPHPAGGGRFSWASRVTALLLALLCAFGWGDVPGLVVWPIRAATLIDDTSLSWEIVDGDTLSITGSGAMPDYASSENVPWYNNRESIQSVSIANGVTHIGDRAFYGCQALTSVVIPGSVESIGNSAFEYCTALASVTITISEGTTSIGDYAFNGCTALSTVTIPASVTSIGDSAFAFTALTTVTIPASVTSIGDSAFASTALTTVTIPATVTSMGDFVYGNCTALATVTIEDGVESIGDSAFSECTALTEVTIPDSVESIGIGAFYGCEKIASIEIPDSVISIGALAFAHCYLLGEVEIPAGITRIEDNAFVKCRALTSVTIPDSVESIGKTAFSACTALTEITIPARVESIDEEAFLECYALTKVTIPASVTSIGAKAFKNCPALTEVTILGNPTLDEVFVQGNKDADSDSPEYNDRYVGDFFKNCIDLEIVNVQPGSHAATYFAENFAGQVTITTSASITYEGTYNLPHSNPDTYNYGTGVSGFTGLTGRTGYTFSGWWSLDGTANGNWGEQVTSIPATATVAYTLYAKWLSADGTLSTLTVDGATPTGAPTATTYNLTVPHDKASVVIAATPTATGKATITGDTGEKSLAYGDNDFVITVTAEDETTQNYTITITRESRVLSIPTAEIVYWEETIFMGNTLENINAAFTINGDPYTTDDNAKIPIDEDWFGEEITIIKKGDGTTTADSLPQELDIPDRPAPPNLTVVDESSFEGGNGKITGLTATTTYEYKPTGGTYTTITGATEIADLAPGDYVVRVKAGSTSFASLDCATLTIAPYVQSTGADLSDLTVSPGTLTPSFHPTETRYTVALPYGISSITVTATASDPNATVSGDGAIPLQTGANSIPITVTAEDGATIQTYTITVTVASPPPVEPDPPAYDPTKPNLPISAPPIPEPPAPEPPAASPVTITTGFQNGRAYRDTRVYGKLEVRAYTADTRVSGRTTGRAVEQLRKLFTQYFENPVAVVSLQPKTPLREATEFAVRVDLSGFDPKNLWFYSYDATSNTYKRLANTEYFLDRNGFLHFTTKAAGDIIISEGGFVRK